MSVTVWPGLTHVYSAAAADKDNATGAQSTGLYLAYAYMFVMAMASALFMSLCFGLASALNDEKV